MYAQLGNIKFETMVGFDSLDDTRAMNYAEHALIDSKPRLQRTGSALQELGISASFHVAFCNPELQYDALNQACSNGEILTLVYGNGYVEGDFVIMSVSRKVNQTDSNGNYVHITCDISLKEYASKDKLVVAMERALSNAFAVDVKRPLPVNIPTVPKSPASATSAYIADAKKQTSFFKKQVDRLDSAQRAVNPLIDKAQAFRDKCQVVQSRLDGYIDKMNVRISQVQDAINVYDIEVLCPDLQAQVNACNAVTSQASSIVGQYVSFPSVVNTVIQATSILSVADQTYAITAELATEYAKLEQAAQGLAAHSISRRKL